MRVIGYARVSTEDQAREGVSLAAQEEKLRAFALVKDWTLSEIAREEGVSGKTLDRPELDRVLSMVEAGDVDAVVVYKLDRLTRSVADLARLLELFERRGVALVSIAESLDATTATGRLMMNLLASVSQWEREVIGERTKAALAHLRMTGKPYSRPVFGYRRNGERLEADPADAEALRIMQELRRKWLSYRDIAARLEAEGIPTKRGGRWKANTVRRVLMRAGKGAA